MINKTKRDKAFLGAVIGAAGSIAGGLITAHKQKQALRQQQKEQNRLDTLQAANAMTSNYANQDYIDDYEDKITLRMGGKEKFKERNNKSLLPKNRRKKAAFGAGDISGAMQGVGSVINALTTNYDTVKKSDNVVMTDAKTSLKTRDYNANNTDITNTTTTSTPTISTYGDRLSQLRVGGKKRMGCRK